MQSQNFNGLPLAEWIVCPLLDPEIARARASVASGKTVGFLRVRLDFPEPCVKWIPCWAELHWLRRPDKLQGNDSPFGVRSCEVAIIWPDDWDDVTGATCWEPFLNFAGKYNTESSPKKERKAVGGITNRGRDWLVNWNRVLLIYYCKKGGNICWHRASASANTSWRQGVWRVSTTKSKYAGPKEYSSNKRRVKVKFFDTIWVHNCSSARFPVLLG